LHSDEEITSKVDVAKPDLVAIDAPLVFNHENRKCDELLREYGALPVTLRGMSMLAERGSALAKKLDNENIKTIEIFSRASAKILGVQGKTEMQVQKNLLSLDLNGDVNRKFLTKDELDAILAAMTGFLYLQNQTETIGDETGSIVIPKV